MSNEQSRQLAIPESPGALQRYLEQAKSAIAMALPPHLNVDRMIRLAVTAYSTTPAIRNCTGQSILGSLVMAAQMGLEPGVRGQAYLIPYKNTCTLVPGWQGLVQLLNNSGRATAWSGAVFQGDEWDFQLGSNPRCFHRPGENHGDPEKLIAFYACGKVNGSEQPVIEAWTAARVWKHRDRFNKVGNRHYSYEHPEMYGRKVVLLQVLKYMPSSIQLANAMTAADAADRGAATTMENGIVVEIDPAPIPAGAVGNPVDDATKKTQEAGAAPQQPAKQPAKTEPPAESAKKPEPDSGAPTEESLRAEIKSKLGKLGKSTKELGVTLVQLEIVKDAKLFSDLTFDELVAASDAWEQIEERLK